MYEVFLLSGITALTFDSTFFACCLVILFSPFALLSSEVTLCTLTDSKNYLLLFPSSPFSILIHCCLFKG